MSLSISQTKTVKICVTKEHASIAKERSDGSCAFSLAVIDAFPQASFVEVKRYVFPKSVVVNVWNYKYPEGTWLGKFERRDPGKKPNSPPDHQAVVVGVERDLLANIDVGRSDALPLKLGIIFSGFEDTQTGVTFASR